MTDILCVITVLADMSINDIKSSDIISSLGLCPS